MAKLDQNRPKKRKIYKERTAKIYALWRSMPFIFHELPMQKLANLGCDIDDEVFRKLVECRNETQFRKIFNVSKGSLASWKKNEKVQVMIDEFNKQSNVLKFKKDIDFHFTQMTIKESDAPRVKLWNQLYEGWTEKSTLGFDTPLIADVRITIIKSKQNGDRDKGDNSIRENLGSSPEPKVENNN